MELPKNTPQKGFASQFLALMIAIVIIGFVYYMYKNKDATPAVVPPALSTYSDGMLSFTYPEPLIVQQDKGIVTLRHFISHRHVDPCDFKGDAPPLEDFTDFKMSFQIVNKDVKGYVESATSPEWDYVSKNPYTFENWHGYHITLGVEGCGQDIYYLIISPSKTLVITMPLVAEFSAINGNRQEYLDLPGIIPPTTAEVYFSLILSSLKVK